jgi:hypothetical protein
MSTDFILPEDISPIPVLKTNITSRGGGVILQSPRGAVKWAKT